MQMSQHLSEVAESDMKKTAQMAFSTFSLSSVFVSFATYLCKVFLLILLTKLDVCECSYKMCSQPCMYVYLNSNTFLLSGYGRFFSSNGK